MHIEIKLFLFKRPWKLGSGVCVLKCGGHIYWVLVGNDLSEFFKKSLMKKHFFNFAFIFLKFTHSKIHFPLKRYVSFYAYIDFYLPSQTGFRIIPTPKRIPLYWDLAPLSSGTTVCSLLLWFCLFYRIYILKIHTICNIPMQAPLA